MADNNVHRELLQRRSIKDFASHGALQAPPDQGFFDTFGYFDRWHLRTRTKACCCSKKRAIAENLRYIEIIFELAPLMVNPGFEQAVQKPGIHQAALTAQIRALTEALNRKRPRQPGQVLLEPANEKKPWLVGRLHLH